MTRAKRAKQFLPFDAMKGLQEALREREERHSRVPRRELGEDEQAEIGLTLQRLGKGMQVEVTYYKAFHELKKTGTVTDFRPGGRYLLLDGEKILFEDLYALEILEY